MAKTIVAIDCMGGDNAPVEIIKGAILAVNENKDLIVKLAGPEDIVKQELDKYTYNKEQVEIINATEVIETGEAPVVAIRQKTDSSLVKCFQMVKKGEADGMVSSGSTGANLVGGHIMIGRLKGVERPALAPLLPTAIGNTLLIDCGANVDARPTYLLQFAQMGSIYMENIMGIKNPKVGLLNIGVEEEKGNALVKEVHPLLKELEGINYIGNIEARDVPAGVADVVVCDAFAGNILLKTYEGVAMTLIKKIKDVMMSNVKTKIGAALIKKDLKNMLKTFSLDSHGGAPLLGLKGLLVKSHGSAKAIEIKNSVLQCVSFNELDFNNKLKEKLSFNK